MLQIHCQAAPQIANWNVKTQNIVYPHLRQISVRVLQDQCSSPRPERTTMGPNLPLLPPSVSLPLKYLSLVLLTLSRLPRETYLLHSKLPFFILQPSSGSSQGSITSSLGYFAFPSRPPTTHRNYGIQDVATRY